MPPAAVAGGVDGVGSSQQALRVGNRRPAGRVADRGRRVHRGRAVRHVDSARGRFLSGGPASRSRLSPADAVRRHLLRQYACGRDLVRLRPGGGLLSVPAEVQLLHRRSRARRRIGILPPAGIDREQGRVGADGRHPPAVIFERVSRVPDTDTLIKRLPKCELHIHIEGSLEPELMFALARRNGISLPYASVEALRRAYQFSNLQDFLDIYYQGMSVLITEQDFYDLAWAYLERARADNLVHVEMFFDPQGHTARGVEFSTVINGLHRAIVDARQALGVRASLIMCFLRHLDEADAERTLDAALAFKDRIVGVGLDSSETGHPPSKFKRVFNRARDAGFFLSAHAGEEGPPSYIWEALDVLGVARIDHGIRSMEDQVLVGRLARDKTALTVCPLSNLRLKVVDDLAKHPLRRMLDKGLVVTVNSDDPAYFGGYVNQNFRAVSDALGLKRDEIVTIVRNGIQASLMTADEKSAAFAEIDRVLAATAN